MKEYYMHGGSGTPQYYCLKCFKTHNKHSKKGKLHWEFRQR